MRRRSSFTVPKAGAEDSLTIRFDGNGFVFDIEPDKNDAIIYVDIPYTTVKLEQALADVSGNLIFNGEIGFKTIFDGAEFSLEKLGYGLKEKEKDGKKIKEFKVNGVKASGSFDTAALFTLDLAKVLRVKSTPSRARNAMLFEWSLTYSSCLRRSQACA